MTNIVKRVQGAATLLVLAVGCSSGTGGSIEAKDTGNTKSTTQALSCRTDDDCFPAACIDAECWIGCRNDNTCAPGAFCDAYYGSDTLCYAITYDSSCGDYAYNTQSRSCFPGCDNDRECAQTAHCDTQTYDGGWEGSCIPN